MNKFRVLFVVVVLLTYCVTATGEAVYVTNKSGSQRATGDVVVLPSGTTANSFTTTTTEGASDTIGVVLFSFVGGSKVSYIENESDGYVAINGGRHEVTTTTSATVGDYLITSTTAGKAKPVSNYEPNAFARVMEVVDSDTVYAVFQLQEPYTGIDEISGPVDGSLTIKADTDLIFQVDADNDGDETFQFKDGGDNTIGELTEAGALQIDSNFTIGANGDTDHTITFDGNSADGVLTWMEDEDYFQFADKVVFDSDIQVSGNNIVDSGGSNGITFDGSGNTGIDLDLTISGNDLKDSGGTWISSDGNQNTSFAGTINATDTTVNTTGNYTAVTIKHTKTAGVTDENDVMRGVWNVFTLNQAGGVIGYTYTGLDTFKITAGEVGTSGSHRTAYGTYGFIDLDGGTIYGNAVAVNARVAQGAGSTVTDNLYGVYTDVDADGTVTGNVYSMYMKEWSNVDYGIYQDGSATNVFGGETQIGGGYGDTGVTISTAGVIQANGAITSDGTITAATYTTAGDITIGSGSANDGRVVFGSDGDVYLHNEDADTNLDIIAPGGVDIGDNSNKTTFAGDGFVEFTGTARPSKCEVFDAARTKLAGISDP